MKDKYYNIVIIITISFKNVIKKSNMNFGYPPIMFFFQNYRDICWFWQHDADFIKYSEMIFYDSALTKS